MLDLLNVIRRLVRVTLLLVFAAVGLVLFLLLLALGLGVLLLAVVNAWVRGRRPTPRVWVQRYGQTAWQQGQRWRHRSAGGSTPNADAVVDVQAREVHPQTPKRLDDAG